MGKMMSIITVILGVNRKDIVKGEFHHESNLCKASNY